MISRSLLPYALVLALVACAPSPAVAAEDGWESTTEDVSLEVMPESEIEREVNEDDEQQGDTSAGPPKDTGDDTEAGAPTASGGAEDESQGEGDALQMAVLGVETAIREFDTESQSSVFLVGVGVCAGVGVGACFSIGINSWGSRTGASSHE